LISPVAQASFQMVYSKIYDPIEEESRDILPRPM
jgi:hypothetical protein